LVDLRGAPALLTRKLPDRDNPPPVMLNHPRLRQPGGNVSDPGDDAIAPEIRKDPLLRVDPVLKGQEDPSLMDQRRYLVQYRRDVVAFDGEDDQIGRSDFRSMLNHGGMNREISLNALDDQSVLRDATIGRRTKKEGQIG